MMDTTAAPAADQGIWLHGLSKHYGNFRALDDIDLCVKPGEFLTLLGPSGSGKSTLLMALAGFVEPSQGRILVDGQPFNNLVPEKRDFGVVFQGYALFPHMSVSQNIAYPLKVRGLQRADIEAKVKEALDLVQLGHLADRLPKQLSGGQQQRVALARALVFSPKVLLLDEPMGALDKKLRHDLQLELRQLHRRLGRTFINVTHDQEEAMAMSDRIAIMRAGKIVQLDAPRVLYDAPKTRFVADFLGKSNFIDGKVKSIDGGMATVETPDGPVLHTQGNTALEVGADVHLALRPQKLVLNGSANSRKVVVETVIFLGTHGEVTLRCASGVSLAANFAISDSQALPAEGSTVEIGWDPSATVAVATD